MAVLLESGDGLRHWVSMQLWGKKYRSWWLSLYDQTPERRCPESNRSDFTFAYTLQIQEKNGSEPDDRL